MNHQFREYTQEELSACGEAFKMAVLAFAKARPNASTTEWTEFNLDWFFKAAAEGLTVDARLARGLHEPLSEGLARRETLGEFMLDMAHTTYPGYKRQNCSPSEYWESALETPCRIRLALESEFGRNLRPEDSFAMVLADAAKLAAIRSDVKVMIFATQDGNEAMKIVGALERLRKQSSDVSPWLWVDLPWDAGKDGVWKPAHGVLS
jgi:hypothetical protein